MHPVLWNSDGKPENYREVPSCFTVRDVKFERTKDRIGYSYSNSSLLSIRGFPDNSVGKESACNAGDPRLIPGSGRSAGEGIGYPLQFSWASLVAQLVKNPPAMRETWV